MQELLVWHAGTSDCFQAHVGIARCTHVMHASGCARSPFLAHPHTHPPVAILRPQANDGNRDAYFQAVYQAVEDSVKSNGVLKGACVHGRAGGWLRPVFAPSEHRRCLDRSRPLTPV